MGKGVALNELPDGKIEVRMENGNVEKFYAEELETEAEVQQRDRDTARRMSEAMRENYDPY